MNNIILGFEKFKKNEYFPFVVLAAIELVLHILFFKPTFGDDPITAHYLDDTTLFEFTKSSFHTWSSRIFIGGIGLVLTTLNMLVWQIADVLMIVLLVYSISTIFIRSNKYYYNWCIVLLFLCYPFFHLSSAGWIATTVIYLWPLSLALYASTLLIASKSLRWYNYLLYGLAALYGCNVEQTSVVFTVIYFSVFMFAIFFKYWILMRRSVFLLLFSLSNLLLHLLSPGNAARNFSETVNWNPDFLMRTIIEKLQLGFSEVFSHFLLAPNIFFLLLTFIIMIVVYKKYNNILCSFIGLLPFIVVSCIGFCNDFLCKIFPALSVFCSKPSIMRGNSVYEGLVNIYNFRYPGQYVSLFLMLLCMLVIILGIYLCIDDDKKAYLAILVFLCGVGSGMIMGFSPTLYASGARTYACSYLCFLLVILMIGYENSKLFSSKFKRFYVQFLAITAGFNLLNLIVDVINLLW